MVVSFAPKGLHKLKEYSIPRLWCSTVAFKTQMELLVAKLDLQSLPPLERLDVLKSCIRSAAKYSRDVLLVSECSGERKRPVLESISRAVWRNDTTLGARLLRTTQLAPELIEIVNNKVIPLDFTAFEAICAQENLIIMTGNKQGSPRNLTQPH